MIKLNIYKCQDEWDDASFVELIFILDKDNIKAMVPVLS